MAGRFVNPFNPSTPSGGALSNAAAALFMGPSPYEMEAREQLAESRAAHSRLYDAQARKAAVEQAILEGRQRLLSQEGMEETVANMAGTTVPGVRTARDYTLGTPGVSPMPPAGPVLDAIRRANVALRTGFADGTINANEIAKAYGEYGNQGERAGIIAGTVDPTRVSQAHFATSGKAPFHFQQEGSGNNLTGAFTINPVGEAEVRQRDAVALSHRAHAGLYGAQAEEQRLINRSGVGGKFRAPVMVNDPEVGPIWAPASSAVGRPPAFKPGTGNTKLVAVQDDVTGETIWVPQADASGLRVGSPRDNRTAPEAQRKPMTSNESKAIDAAILALTGAGKENEVDPTFLTNLKAKARDLTIDPKSEHYRRPEDAVQAALSILAPAGVEDQKRGIPLVSSRYAPRGAATAAGAVTPAAPASSAQPTQLPAAARARLREGVVTTFGNGTQWTLQNGTPVQVR